MQIGLFLLWLWTSSHFVFNNRKTFILWVFRDHRIFRLFSRAQVGFILFFWDHRQGSERSSRVLFQTRNSSLQFLTATRLTSFLLKSTEKKRQREYSDRELPLSLQKDPQQYLKIPEIDNPRFSWTIINDASKMMITVTKRAYSWLTVFEWAHNC